MTNFDVVALRIGALGVTTLAGCFSAQEAYAQGSCERVKPAQAIVDIYARSTDDSPKGTVPQEMLQSVCVLGREHGRYKIRVNREIVWAPAIEFVSPQINPPQPLQREKKSRPAGPVAHEHDGATFVGERAATGRAGPMELNRTGTR
jgi:hypothetical protein